MVIWKILDYLDTESGALDSANKLAEPRARPQVPWLRAVCPAFSARERPKPAYSGIASVLAGLHFLNLSLIAAPKPIDT